MGYAGSKIMTDWNNDVENTYNLSCPSANQVCIIENVQINLGNLPSGCHDTINLSCSTTYEQSCVINNIINVTQNFAEQNEAFAKSTFSLSGSESIIGINGQNIIRNYIDESCGDTEQISETFNVYFNQSGGCPNLSLAPNLTATSFCALTMITADVQSFAASNTATAETVGLLGGLFALVFVLIIGAMIASGLLKNRSKKQKMAKAAML